MVNDTQHSARAIKSAAYPKEAIMANLQLGSLVVNFNTTAKVVGFWRAADGQPHEMTGWPILKALGANGKPKGGKWVADPSKCEAA